MINDWRKDRFAGALAEAFRNVYPDLFESVGDTEVFSRRNVCGEVEKPKDPTMGRFAFPVFRYLRLLKEPPPSVTAKVSAEANRLLEEGNGAPPVICTSTGGYINAVVNAESLARDVIGEILKNGRSFGNDTVGKDKTALIEYSSPNIAKPFGVGHLRTTVLGHSLKRIFRKIGYTVVGINYPGDWGTQFGKMIVAYRKWGDENTLEGDSVSELLDLYVRYHREVKDDADLDGAARTAFRELEEGNPEAVALWKKFKKISNAEFERIYSALGIDFDLVIGESFFNDKMAAVIDRLKRAGLTKLSEGALIVELGDPNLPPAMLRKRDGATLYVTRDLAGLVYRWDKYRFAESLYVVGSAQADHFRQCLKVISLLEEAEKLPPEDRMTGKVKHIDFGWVRFDNRAMSTRAGNIVLLDDVISEAVSRARDKIREKNPELAEIDRVAHLIGVGAILFSQLSVRRHKDVNFLWDDVLNFEGETGPYLQYTHARLCSLLRNADRDITAEVDFELLTKDEERRVVESLADFPGAVHDAARLYEPYLISGYLLRLAAAFNRVYQRKDDSGRIDRILSDDSNLTAARLALVKSVQLVLKEGLYLLGLEAPDEM